MENKIDEQCRACIFFDGGCKSAILAGLRKELKKCNKFKTQEQKDEETRRSADKSRAYNRTHKKRAGVVNICTRRANWNACPYIDMDYQEYCAEGCECWKQDAPSACVGCVQVERQNKKGEV